MKQFYKLDWRSLCDGLLLGFAAIDSNKIVGVSMIVVLARLFTVKFTVFYFLRNHCNVSF